MRRRASSRARVRGDDASAPARGTIVRGAITSGPCSTGGTPHPAPSIFAPHPVETPVEDSHFRDQSRHDHRGALRQGRPQDGRELREARQLRLLRRREVPSRHPRFRRAGRRPATRATCPRATRASGPVVRAGRSSARRRATRASTRSARSRWRTPARTPAAASSSWCSPSSNTRHLNGVHTVFGKITGGLDVMKQIKKNDVMNQVRVA